MYQADRLYAQTGMPLLLRAKQFLGSRYSGGVQASTSSWGWLGKKCFPHAKGLLEHRNAATTSSYTAPAHAFNTVGVAQYKTRQAECCLRAGAYGEYLTVVWLPKLLRWWKSSCKALFALTGDPGRLLTLSIENFVLCDHREIWQDYSCDKDHQTDLRTLARTFV